MIDHVWRERLVLSDRMIELKPSPRFALVCRFEGLRRAAIQGCEGDQGPAAPLKNPPGGLICFA